MQLKTTEKNMQQQISEHPSMAISKLNDTEIILRKLRFYKLF